MTETIVTVNSVDLCVETFGDPRDPALLLIPGVAGSMDTWEPDFCAALAATGRFVIRYDLRDTGRSVSYPPGAPDYSFYDLVDDAVALIDRYASGPADLAGLSMGGALCQYLAIDHPDKVASLTLIATSPAFPADLPPLTPALLEAYASLEQPDSDDPEAALEYGVAMARVHSGPDVFDEDAAREQARRVLARTADPRTLGNHNAMKQADRPERDVRALVGAIAKPTLVIHGSADPMFPLEHGKALAEAIPDAVLLVLDGVGHQPPPRSTWDRVLPAMPYSPNTRRV